jgi:uridine kinase
MLFRLLSSLSLCIYCAVSEGRPLLVGICGGTAAGKTTFARMLSQELGGALVVDQDSYYHDTGHLSQAERALLNFDEPSAIDFDLFVQHLNALKQGHCVWKPWRSFVTGARDPSKATQLCPTACILVEGILVFADPRCTDLFDLKIFVDLPADLRLLRRIERDQVRNGQSLGEIRDQYLGTVRPMYDLWTAPSRNVADVIVRGDADWKAIVPMLRAYADAKKGHRETAATL